MCLIGAVTWWRGGLVFIGQILGSMSAAAVVSALFPGEMNVSTTLGGGSSIVQGLFIEMFLTAMLVFTIFMLAAEKHKGTFIAPIGIGLALFIAELTGQCIEGSLARHMLTICRRLLHRWLPEPCALLRSLRCPSRLPRLSLDILAWTSPWLAARCRFLQARQDARIRDGESWSRFQ